jgi:5'-deoxynucleotidase YfbR-like HD superfamily hydrolase
MTTQEIQFIKDNIINFESVKLGFTRNIPFPVLEKYEEIYRKYLDSQFTLTYWCGECVFDMLKRLIKYYESQVITVQATQESKVETLQEKSEQLVSEFKEFEKNGGNFETWISEKGKQEISKELENTKHLMTDEQVDEIKKIIEQPKKKRGRPKK